MYPPNAHENLPALVVQFFLAIAAAAVPCQNIRKVSSLDFCAKCEVCNRTCHLQLAHFTPRHRRGMKHKVYGLAVKTLTTVPYDIRIRPYKTAPQNPRIYKIRPYGQSYAKSIPYLYVIVYFTDKLL